MTLALALAIGGVYAAAQDRPSRAHNALTDGIECYRRGDYEFAARFFEQAQVGLDDLGPTERQELTNRIQANNAALRARREGADMLRRAEDAARTGHVNDALELLKQVSSNQFVSPGDKQRAQRLTELLRGGPARPTPTAMPPEAAAPLARARAKLQQARTLLARGDLAAAEALAKEAEALNAPYTAGEDTPARVRADIQQARLAKAAPLPKDNKDTKVVKDTKTAPAPAAPAKDPKGLLAAARQAVDRGDLDHAEQLALEADRAESAWSMHMPWSDTPAKVLKDVQAAKSKRLADKAKSDQAKTVASTQPSTATPTASKPAATQTASAAPTQTAPAAPTTGLKNIPGIPTAQATPEADTQAAREFLKQGRQALQQGNTAKARELCDQAAKKKPLLDWWEPDNPEKLLADIRRAEGKQPASSTASASGADQKPEPKALLRQAREQYSAGKLEEAKDLCQRANACPGAHWGLFDDCPDKLLVDIQKARVKREQEESAKVLVEARKLYEKGEYDEAEKKANRAERLHGPYSMWELGDRPSKVVADCQAARTKEKKTTMPPAPGEIVQKDTKTDPKKAADKNSVANAQTAPTGTAAPKPDWSSKPAGSQVAQQPGTSQPGTPAGTIGVVSGTGGTLAQGVSNPTGIVGASGTAVGVGSGSGGNLTQGIGAPATVGVISGGSGSVVQGTSPGTGTPGQQPLGTDPAKEAALRLMAEARSLQREGRLIEARQKALEAQKPNASFGPDEDRPERALIELADLCNRKIENLMQHAADCVKTGQEDPASFREAEANLSMARQLAAGFGLDTLRIDQRLDGVHQAQSQAMGRAPNLINAPSSPFALTPSQSQVPPDQRRGMELLQKAVLELRAGNVVVARRLAEEAYNSEPSVHPQAEDMLRQCDVEEFNQRQLAMIHTFEAAVVAFRDRDYVRSYTLLKEVDPRMLPADKRSRMSDMMLSPEMQQAVAAAQRPQPAPASGAVVQAGNTQPAGDFAAEVSAMQEIKFQQLHEQANSTLREATSVFSSNPDEAIDILSHFKGQIDDSGLDRDRVTLLRRPIDSRIEQFKTLKAQQEFNRLARERRETVNNKRFKDQKAEEAKVQGVRELLDQYKRLEKEGKYREAEMCAVKARELDPDSPAIDAYIYTARILANQADVLEGKKGREDMFTEGLNDAENQGPFVGKVDDPIRFRNDKDWQERLRRRKPSENILVTKMNEKEREIERRLNLPINLEFKDTPLKQAMDDLRVLTGMNIVIDQPALDNAGVSTDRPLSMRLEGVSMKSALTLLLHNVNLTYVIKDEVLQITTESAARGRLIQKTFPVADLIIPVDNYIIPAPAQLMKVLGQDQQSTLRTTAMQPSMSATSMQNGESVGAPSGPVSITQSKTPPAVTGNPVASTRSPGQTSTMEELLIRLITNTVAPSSWAEVGGPGTIDYFPLGMALVINQTPDVQEQVQELLDALRRLQDLEISVEVRMIDLEEAFFERIGVDFNVNLLTNPNTKSQQPLIVTQQFAPLNFINNFQGHDTIIGLQPGSSGGTNSSANSLFTSDLAVPITNSSFQYAIPPFGGYPAIPGADGGISMGLAFLSDVQVFLFMEAAQGDKRTNVMQAPKLTLFNGQTSTIQIQDFQYFVTNVQVLQAGGQIAYVPQNQPVPVGVNLAVQAVVSADRRFVRLNLAPTMTNVASATVPLFPITTFITPVFEGGAQGQPVPFTQFIQQPTFTSITIQTTVSVPDGGTVLLGGMKILNEGRNEFGPPILSKIPYIDRLFKNVGYGKDTSSLLLMVTPRIIINAEEEERQTGLTTGGPGGTGPVPQ
jgi:type II secretory pathway component GspD/PulD (secretin)